MMIHAHQLTMRQAAVIQFVSKYSNVVIQLVITMVLARLLTPAEFGTVSIVTVFTNFFLLLSDMGLSAGIVQHKELDDKDLSGLFVFTVGMSVVLVTLFLLLGIPVSLLYGNGLLRVLFAAAAPGVFFSALNSVPNGMLLRQRRFVAVGVRLVVVNVMAGVVAVALAFAGAGCYALVAQFSLSCTFVFLWNFLLAQLHVRRVPVLKPLRAIFEFSAFQFAHGLGAYFFRNLDNLLVGLVFGSSALGYYDKAYKLTTYPVSGFTSVIASVVHPFLSDYQDDPQTIYRKFLDMTRSVFAVGILMSACFVAAPAEIVTVVFGDQWQEAVPLFRVLSVSVMFQMITSLTGSVFQSLGNTREMFYTTVVNTCIMICAILGGVALRDVFALAVLVSLAVCVNPVATFYYLVVRAFGMPMGGFVRAMLPQLLVAFAMMGVGVGVHALMGLVSLPLWPVLPLVLKLAVCAGCYVGILLLTGQWQYVRALVGRI